MADLLDDSLEVVPHLVPEMLEGGHDFAVIRSYARLTLSTIGGKVKTPVLYFEEEDRYLRLNSPRLIRQALEILGRDTATYTGKRIKLVVEQVRVRGEYIPTIRIKPAPSLPNGKQKQTKTTPRPPRAPRAPRAPRPQRQPVAPDDVPFRTN